MFPVGGNPSPTSPQAGQGMLGLHPRTLGRTCTAGTTGAGSEAAPEESDPVARCGDVRGLAPAPTGRTPANVEAVSTRTSRRARVAAFMDWNAYSMDGGAPPGSDGSAR